MSTQIRPLRIVPEDIKDKKVAEAIAPLLEALNETIAQLVTFAANTPTVVITDMSPLTADEYGAAYVDIRSPLPTKVRCVGVADIRRPDEVPVDGGYGFWWTPNAIGLRLLFVGLEAGIRYNFSVRVE